jgi:hypothetical protein
MVLVERRAKSIIDVAGLSKLRPHLVPTRLADHGVKEFCKDEPVPLRVFNEAAKNREALSNLDCLLVSSNLPGNLRHVTLAQTGITLFARSFRG